MKKNYKEEYGCLISKALDGEFDVIAHGCNCFCVQGVGIAKQMRDVFNTQDTSLFPEERKVCIGAYRKLGNIEWALGHRLNDLAKGLNLIVINAYTQYQPGRNLDYEALTLCLRKINHTFSGKHIGLPQVGCGIAGGDWNRVKQIIQQELKDCTVTVVIYKP